MTKERWVEVQEFQDKNKDLLFIVASPKTDEITIGFNGLYGFVKFPTTTMDKGVVFNALRKSKFNQAIDAFMTGLINATGIEEKDEGAELLNVVGGGIKSVGIDSKRSKLEVINKKDHAKEN